MTSFYVSSAKRFEKRVTNHQTSLNQFWNSTPQMNTRADAQLKSGRTRPWRTTNAKIHQIKARWHVVCSKYVHLFFLLFRAPWRSMRKTHLSNFLLLAQRVTLFKCMRKMFYHIFYIRSINCCLIKIIRCNTVIRFIWFTFGWHVATLWAGSKRQVRQVWGGWATAIFLPLLL